MHVPTCQIFKYQLCSASENTSAHMSRYSNRRAVFLNQSLCFVKVTLFFNCHYTDRDLSKRILNQVPTARFPFEDQESGLRLDIAIQGVRITDSGLMIINQGRDQCPTRDQWPISWWRILIQCLKYRGVFLKKVTNRILVEPKCPNQIAGMNKKPKKIKLSAMEFEEFFLTIC